tara:strand:+ start:564 stop:671 length:108 start_codon:yes stop_codon:yes gene_type:complete
MNNLIIKTIICAVMFLIPAKILLALLGGAFYVIFY